MKDNIKIIDAYEHNLKHVSIEIPKKKITVFTGVSGSGKSSLCMDTLAAESRRELNETFPSFVQQYLPKYGRPHVGAIENLPITMVLDQKKPASNSRSTVATYTDIYAFLRLLYSRIGSPFVGYSDHFSFNHPSGMCKRCSGLGEVVELNIHKLVDFDKCLNDEGVINFPAFTTGAWRWKRYAYSGLFDLDKKIKHYSEEELNLFLYSPQIKLKNPPDNWPKSAKFEGIYPRMYRSIIHTKEGKRHKKTLDKMISKFTCPDCGGTRLNDVIRSCKINQKSIADILLMPIPSVITFVKKIDHELAVDIRAELIKRLTPLVEIGLGYLTLSRGMSTLSGGEAQRIKISKYINSALTDVVYVLDEPTVGLHPHDVHNIINSIKALRDRGNTILIVEHHNKIIEMADFIIDLGPESGTQGGEIVFSGSYKELLKSGTTTANALITRTDFKSQNFEIKEVFSIKNASLHNLKNLSLDLPLNALTVLAGVAGSGKSSLLNCLIEQYDGPKVIIDQKSIGTNSRSTPATYLDISDTVRKIFATENKINPSYFSFNSKGGCETCKGRGVIVSEMAFMNAIETECESCHGTRYNTFALSHRYKGLNISEALSLTVEEALSFYTNKDILSRLRDLQIVGLGYLSLSQSMTTLSGGELQRIKLASKLNQKGSMYILDEPTSGLHLKDVRQLINLFTDIVEKGNTVVIVDHHMDLIKVADHLIEIGPMGGEDGGQLLYEGLPMKVMASNVSITKAYL